MPDSRRELDLNPLALDERNRGVLERWRDVLRRAEEAWAAMLHASDPMPAWAALDYVQDVADDRRTAFEAIVRTVGTWLDVRRPGPIPDVTERARGYRWAEQIIDHVSEGHCVPAASTCRRLWSQAKEWNLNTSSERDHRTGDLWMAWCRQAALAIRIARQLFAAWAAFGGI